MKFIKYIRSLPIISKYTLAYFIKPILAKSDEITQSFATKSGNFSLNDIDSQTEILMKENHVQVLQSDW